MELNIIFKSQYNGKRKTNLTKNYSKKTVKRKWKKNIYIYIIKCATWKVRAIAHLEE